MEIKTTKCIVMSRVSTTIQDLDVQEEECIQMAMRDGYSQENMILIPRVGESARKVGEIIKVDTPRGPMEVELDRDGIWEMKKHIENDPNIDCVYVWEVSRLARRSDVLGNLLKYFEVKKVQLKIKTNHISLLHDDKSLNETNKMMIIILGQVAEQEMNVKIERFKRSKRVLAEQGRFSGGGIPYGYKVDKERGGLIVINEEEAKLVHEIYDMYESGLSQIMIAREFYCRGMFNFTLSKVNHILLCEQYIGKPVKKGKSSYFRTYPVIISQEQFDRCREIAAGNKTFVEKGKKKYYAHNLIVCSCGEKFVPGPSKVCYACKEIYRTNNPYEVHHHKCDSKLTISINIMDSLVWKVAQEAEVKYILKSAEEDKALYQKQISILDEKLNSIESRLNHLDTRFKRLGELYAMQIIETREELNEKVKEITNERQAVFQEQASYTNEREHLIDLCNGIEKYYDYDDLSKTKDKLSKISMLRDKISSITEDSQRCDIAHRHIKKITLENKEIEVEFGIAGKKVAKSRFITIELYNGEILYFQYVPFTGGKNLIMKAAADGTPISKYDFEYLPRFTDHGKKRRRANEKEKREKDFAEKFPSEKYVVSFASFTAYLGLKDKTTYKLVNHGFLSECKEWINNREAAFNKEKCIELARANADSNKWARIILSNLGIDQ